MSKKDQRLEDAARAIIKQQFERGLRQGANGVTGAIYEMLTSSSTKEGKNNGETFQPTFRKLV